MFPIKQLSRQTRLRRAISLLCVAALLAGATGVRIPAIQIAKESTELYPCMHCSCGCSNAEMCWRNCCCHTQQEKVAWARKNGVTPPAYVVAAAKLELKESSEGAVKCCCCKVKSPDEQQNVETAKPASNSLVMFQALKCQGLGGHWVFAPLSLPAADRVGTPELLPLETVAVVTFCFTSFQTPPITPPPEFS